MVASRSIIWSPHNDRNQFLVSGAELKLYEWLPETNELPGRAHFISSIPNITLMMCADWSPDPNCPDLVAVGLTTGKTLLVRMQEHALTDSPFANSEGIQTPTPLQRTNTIGRNQANTNHNTGSSNTGSMQQPYYQQQQYPVLGVKMSRPCNVVSFSKTHPHLLAAGLDKVRNDPCLLVWDISRSLDSYSNTPSGSQTPTSSNFTIRGQSQQESRASITNQWKLNMTITQMNDNYEDRQKYSDIAPISTSGSGSREQGPVRQYGSSEAIASCVWSEHTNSPLLIAGMGNKYLRVYDIRADPGSSPLQYATKAVNGAMVDPFNPYRIASYTEEGVIKVWDLRKNNDAILTLNPETSSKNTLSHIAFSPSRPGFLASLAKDAFNIDIWDIQETRSYDYALNSASKKGNSFSVRPEQSSIYQPTKLERTPSSHTLHTLTAQVNENELDIPVLWKSRKTSTSVKPLASFAFIPTNSTPPSTHQLLTMHKDGKFEAVKIQETCQLAWQPAGGMVITGNSGLLSYCPTLHDSSGKDDDIDFEGLGLDEEENEVMNSSNETGEKQINIRQMNNMVLSAELDKDISVVMRKRLIEGYSMDYEKNIQIVKDDRKLKELWSWMKRADQISAGLSKVGNVDYSFHGVYGIWTGPGTSGRRSSPANTPRPNSSPKARSQSSIRSHYSKSKDDSYNPYEKTGDSTNSLPMAQTSKLGQRNIALSACGSAFDANEFEKKLIELESRGEYDKAAGWALFYGNPERAIKALGSTRGLGHKDEQQRKLMSAVLAGYQAGGANTNSTWKDICESLSNDMTNRPYLRAIFAYIASNDWYRVLDEPELPLRERMAIALRVLNDEEMTTYLNRTVESLVQEGNMEGIIVTGLTLRGVDLLERALDRYGDVQTASLVMSFIVPKRFKDNRVENWVENYRLLMDRWQLWHARAKFDIERGTRMNSSEIAPPQVYVRCNFCAQSLGHSLVIQNARNREGKRMNVQTSNPSGRISGKQKSNVCSSCRKPLPRCALCLMHMGTPIDNQRQAIAANDTHNVDPAGFDLWFTWCQTCRHGGHALHMLDWFQTHSTCPVSTCTCQCQI
ncbi:hypothetical protein K501DRAFT_236548 [Backusella circina FSU 941]|nr:hypothetical protein K501DRAFT_236548 [Backusella circina FSU 941]